jgi:hypothetical protein
MSMAVPGFSQTHFFPDAASTAGGCLDGVDTARPKQLLPVKSDGTTTWSPSPSDLPANANVSLVSVATDWALTEIQQFQPPYQIVHDATCSAPPTLSVQMDVRADLRLQAYLYDSASVSTVHASAQLANMMKLTSGRKIRLQSVVHGDYVACNGNSVAGSSNPGGWEVLRPSMDKGGVVFLCHTDTFSWYFQLSDAGTYSASNGASASYWERFEIHFPQVMSDGQPFPGYPYSVAIMNSAYSLYMNMDDSLAMGSSTAINSWEAWYVLWAEDYDGFR